MLSRPAVLSGFVSENLYVDAANQKDLICDCEMPIEDRVLSNLDKRLIESSEVSRDIGFALASLRQRSEPPVRSALWLPIA